MVVLVIFWTMSSFSNTSDAQQISANTPDNIRVLLDTLSPLPHDVGDRELLYQ